MANTYSRIYYHVVFAVRGRRNLISKQWQQELYKYITGIVTQKNHKLMQINGMPDHIHILIGSHPNCKLSDLVRDIKSNSTKWINEMGFVKGKFSWQTGFGAFTVGHPEVHIVINYIKNQEQHHLRRTFRKEYLDVLKKNDVDFNEDYIFK